MKVFSLRGWLTALGLCAAFVCQSSWALAGTTGNISGTVRDALTGAPLAGVRLQIASPSQTVSVTTDAHGRFIAFALQPDDYTLTAEKIGYREQAVSGYLVFADQTQQYDLTLDPASAAPPG